MLLSLLSLTIINENECDELLQKVAKNAEQKEVLDTLIDSFSLIPVDAPAFLSKVPNITVLVEGLSKGEQYWNAKEMTIDVRFNTKIEERSRFDVRLTFGSRKPAAKECVIVLRKGQIGKLHLNLEARGLYTAGDYILQILHNGNPYLEYPFSVNEKGEVSEGKVTILNKNSMASYLMGSDLDSENGKKLMALCGCQEVKSLAANFVLQKRINDLRSDLLLPSLWNLNFVLYENGMQDMDDLSSCLGKIVFGENVEQEYIDLSDDEIRLFVCRRDIDGHTKIERVKYREDRKMSLSELWMSGLRLNSTLAANLVWRQRMKSHLRTS